MQSNTIIGRHSMMVQLVSFKGELLETDAGQSLDSNGRHPHSMTTPPPTVQQPALWNPNATANWSLLFSVAFGAFLHARNAAVLGRVAEAKANKVWFYVSLAYFGFALASAFAPPIPARAFTLAGLGILLGWYLSLGRKQITYVRMAFPDGYERRSWKEPLLIGFACLPGS